MRFASKKILATYCLILFLLLLTFSCQEKDEPGDGKVTVFISGIELLNPSTYPSARLQSTSTWSHTFENKLTLTFESGSGEKFALDINPNVFSTPYSISLPLGNYTLTGSSTTTDPFALLPIRIVQQLAISSAGQNIALRATSDYGLWTITNENLGAFPPEDLSNSRKLFLRDRFYYRYAPANTELNIKVALANGKNSVNLKWKADSFTHRHINLDNLSNANDVVSFAPTDFALNQSVLLLSDQGLPTALAPVILAELPASQTETSGLAYLQGRLFSINDGGNTNEIFELNPVTGAVIRAIKVSNGTNRDWEELAQSETHLFIGDFGNNAGNRKDLAVLKIPIAAVLGATEVVAEELRFTFSDQTDFSGNGGNHNYDCEAFFFANNQLHLFTKNRGDQKTNHYTLSPTLSSSQATLLGSFDVKGLVTAAGIDPEGKVCLLGYEDAGFASRSFVWLFSDYTGTDYLKGKSTRIILGSPAQLSQTEGLVFDQTGQVIISGEGISVAGATIPARLSKLDLSGLF